MNKLYIFLLVILLAAIAVAYTGYQWVYGVNTIHSDPKDIYIPTNATYDEVLGILDDDRILKNLKSFDAVAKLMKYDQNFHAGHYVLQPEQSNRALITLLRSGKQVPVNVTISAARKLEDIAGVVATMIEADSSQIHTALLEPSFLNRKDLDASSVISLIIPNTYEFFWDSNAQDFIARMEKEYDRFWNEKRVKQAEDLDMSRLEVATLASIVEKESNLKAERPTLAGVYINRLRSGIPLQADPTVVFGIGDFTIRRVLNVHLAVDTPYNTYMHPGLPPGPICMPTISSIDSVLNPENHDYIFFCAKPGYNNGHLFAKTNAEHERNARIYHRWLNSEGIKG